MGKPWRWDTKEEEAFDQIKNLLIVIVLFNKNTKTRQVNLKSELKSEFAARSEDNNSNIKQIITIILTIIITIKNNNNNSSFIESPWKGVFHK